LKNCNILLNYRPQETARPNVPFRYGQAKPAIQFAHPKIFKS
jgi:hypothetical protein